MQVAIVSTLSVYADSLRSGQIAKVVRERPHQVHTIQTQAPCPAIKENHSKPVSNGTLQPRLVGNRIAPIWTAGRVIKRHQRQRGRLVDRYSPDTLLSPCNVRHIQYEKNRNEYAVKVNAG